MGIIEEVHSLDIRSQICCTFYTLSFVWDDCYACHECSHTWQEMKTKHPPSIEFITRIERGCEMSSLLKNFFGHR